MFIAGRAQRVISQNGTLKGWRVLFAAIFAISAVSASHAGESDDEMIWTDRPVRIDRSSQNYERVAPRETVLPMPYTLRMGTRPDVPDGGSFRLNGTLYILRNIVTPPLEAICEGEGGRRWTCGRHAAYQLRSLLFRRTLKCALLPLARDVKLAQCRSSVADPELTLINKGLAVALSGVELASQQEQAKRQRIGIWDNVDCRMDDRACW